MALGPKELGSWANDSTLSTEIRGRELNARRARRNWRGAASVCCTPAGVFSLLGLERFKDGHIATGVSGSPPVVPDPALRAPMTGPSRGWGWGRRRSGLGCRSGFGLWGRSVLLQVVKNTHVVVGGIKLGSECAPNAFFECDIDLP